MASCFTHDSSGRPGGGPHDGNVVESLGTVSRRGLVGCAGYEPLRAGIASPRPT